LKIRNNLKLIRFQIFSKK